MRDSRNSQRIGSSALMSPKRMILPQESEGVGGLAAISVYPGEMVGMDPSYSCSWKPSLNSCLLQFMRFCFFCDMLRSDDGMVLCIDV